MKDRFRDTHVVGENLQPYSFDPDGGECAQMMAMEQETIANGLVGASKER